MGYEEWVNTGSSVRQLSIKEKIGAAFCLAFAIISAVFVLAFFANIICTIFPLHRRAQHEPPSPNRVSSRNLFPKVELASLVVCLLFSDILQCIGGMIQGQWVVSSAVSEGILCTVQAALLQLSDNATAFWSAAIALYTFYTAIFRGTFSTRSTVVTVVGGWAFLLLTTLLGPLALSQPSRGPFYGISGSWCFVTSAYSIERTILNLLFMILSALIILFCYIILYLVVRGFLLVDEWPWRFTTTPLKSIAMRESEGDVQREMDAAANRLLWYPISYIVLILPLVVCHLLLLNGHVPSQISWLAAMDVLLLMGVANTLICIYARHFNPFRCLYRRKELSSTSLASGQTALSSVTFEKPPAPPTPDSRLDMA